MLPSAKSLNIFKRSTPSGDSNVSIVDCDNETEKEEEKNINKPKCKKIKTFPSIRNQFVIHIYYHLDDNEIIQDINQDFVNKSNLIFFEKDPHISFVYGHYAVQYHQIEPLMNQLSDLIKSFETFSLCLNHVKILPNSDQSRFFIAICESTPLIEKKSKDKEIISKNEKQKQQQQQLKKPQSINRVLIKSIHHILKQYRSEIVTVDQETLDNFIFHTSVAWFHPENSKHAQTFCDQLNQYFDDRVIFVKVNRINIRVGHISRIINLL